MRTSGNFFLVICDDIEAMILLVRLGRWEFDEEKPSRNTRNYGK